MKWKFLLLAGLCLTLASYAQTDTTGKSKPLNDQTDTIHNGNMLIIKDGKEQSNDEDDERNNKHYHYNYKHHSYKPSNISTNWCIVDLGFANFNDKTNYSSASVQQ